MGMNPVTNLAQTKHHNQALPLAGIDGHDRQTSQTAIARQLACQVSTHRHCPHAAVTLPITFI